MSRAQWSLAKLAEECGEVVQAIAKIQGNDLAVPPYKDRAELFVNLVEEMGDLRAALIFACESNGIPKKDVHDRADVKLERFRGWNNG